LTLWHTYQAGSADEKALLKLIVDAKSTFADTPITVQQVQFSDLLTRYHSDIANGKGPDLFVAPNDGLSDWVRARLVIDLTARLAGKLDQVSQPGVDGMKVGGKIYGVPESVKVVALYYNKSLLPAPPRSADELLALARSGKSLTLFNGAYHMFGFSGVFDGKLFDASYRCIADQGGWTEALQFVLDLKTAGATIETDYAKSEALFRTGKATMFINGPWALADYRQNLGDKLGVALIPAGKGKANPLNRIDGFYVSSTSRNAEAALALALFLTSKAAQELYATEAGHVPVRADVAAGDPLLAVFVQAAAQGYSWPQSAEFANFWAPFDNMWVKVVEGAQKPAEAVRLACASMNLANKK
jgi:arabinogalactan oligomer/maltooligosaccharide transport system substrate-binding protein